MKTDYEFLKTDIDGHILTVTINRPERMNALHPLLMQNLMKFGMSLIKTKIFGLVLSLVKVIVLFLQETILSFKLKLEARWILIWLLQVLLV